MVYPRFAYFGIYLDNFELQPDEYQTFEFTSTIAQTTFQSVLGAGIFLTIFFLVGDLTFRGNIYFSQTTSIMQKNLIYFCRRKLQGCCFLLSKICHFFEGILKYLITSAGLLTKLFCLFKLKVIWFGWNYKYIPLVLLFALIGQIYPGVFYGGGAGVYQQFEKTGNKRIGK